MSFIVTLCFLQLESFQAENEQLKDRVEELSLDLEILKNEISEGGNKRNENVILYSVHVHVH